MNVVISNDNLDNSSKRDGPPASPSSNRVAKRTKQPTNETMNLPAEMWAVVMNSLDFSSVLSLTATTRTMRDAAPFVTELHINKSCQMHVSVGRRFRDVRTIYIYTLIQQLREDLYAGGFDDDTPPAIDFETTARAVLFAAAFGNLKKICFGGMSVNGTWLYSVVPFSNFNFRTESFVQEFEQQFSRLTDSISIGYRCGALHPSLEVKGLLCPQCLQDKECIVCRRACENFPVDSVVDFECRENQYELAYSLCMSRNSYYNIYAPCLGRDELMSILETRPDGKNALYSKRSLLEILGRCSRDPLGIFQGKQIWILNFSHQMENSLKRKLSKLRVKGADLNPSEISDALLQSFPQNKGYAYILSDAMRRCLRDIGMQIDEEVFGSARYLLNLAKILYPQIAKFRRDEPRTHLDECMHLMTMLVSEEEPPIQGIIDSGVMPDLIEGLKRPFDREYQASCIHILSRLLQSKNEDQVKAILDYKFLDGLGYYFSTASSDRPMTFNAIKDSCKSLECIIGTSVTLRDSVLRSGVLDSLLSFMNHRDFNDCQPCIELWQNIRSSYKDNSPIEISLMNIRFEWMAPLLTSGIVQLIDFVASVLSLEVENFQSSDATLFIAPFTSYAVPIKDLLLSSKYNTRALSIRVFYLLSELDFFGSIANQFDKAAFESMFGAFTKILDLTPKTTEDEKLLKQACKSMGYLIRNWYCKPDVDIPGHERPRKMLISSFDKYLLPWVKTVVKLSNDGDHLTVLQHHLLLRISKSIDKGVPIRECRLGVSSFAELLSLLEIESSMQDVRNELMVSMKKKTPVAIEDQLDQFVEYCIEEEDEKPDEDDDYSEDSADDDNDYFVILSQEEINLISDRLPLTMQQLIQCGIRRRTCYKYGERLLRITAVYNNAINIDGYHNRDVLSILADCAAQISVE